jgi:hypothetical protein
VAFAKYAFFYVFDTPYNVGVYNFQVPSGAVLVSVNQARPGDIFVWNNYHVAMYLGEGLFYHSNFRAANQVSYGTGFNRGAPDYIVRANNYDEVDNAVTIPPKPPELLELLGDVNGDGTVDINDAVEILKYVVGLDSVIAEGNIAWKNALIVSETEPGIEDALEILKYMVGLENALEANPHERQRPRGEN